VVRTRETTSAGYQRALAAHQASKKGAGGRVPQMRQLPQVEQAMGAKTLALLRQLEAACISADELAAAAVESFERHPDAEIITSFPGLGSLTGARVLAEIGRRPIPLRRRTLTQGLRRGRTGHPGVRQVRLGPGTPRQEPASGLWGAETHA
jgi:transposase